MLAAALIGSAALLSALHSPSPAARARVLEPMLVAEERAHRLPPRLLARLARRESNFRPWVRGDHRRSLGLFQLRRGTEGLTDAQLFEPATNAHLAAVWLRRNYETCGSWSGALTKFNHGHGCGGSIYSRRVLLADVAR